MTPLAWLGALAIGLTLGLLGAGGSILTVPVLVYLVGEPAKAAVAESLAIVGTIAAVSVVPYARKRLVSWHTVLLFSLPGMMGSYVGALAGKLVSGNVQITAFSGLMVLAGILMMRRPSKQKAPADCPPDAPIDTSAGAATAAAATTAAGSQTQGQSPIAALVEGLIVGVEGFVIGMATGFLGVGGGFLIVPALVLLVGLPMHLAIGTSLATIALNSAAGFYKSAQLLPSLHLHLNWPVIASFVTVGIAGSLTGSAICHRLPQQRLRRLFAWVVLAMGLYLLWRNLSGMHAS
jgi:uncharacterized membrane protein YfcA